MSSLITNRLGGAKFQIGLTKYENSQYSLPIAGKVYQQLFRVNEQIKVHNK